METQNCSNDSLPPQRCLACTVIHIIYCLDMQVYVSLLYVYGIQACMCMHVYACTRGGQRLMLVLSQLCSILGMETLSLSLKLNDWLRLVG